MQTRSTAAVRHLSPPLDFDDLLPSWLIAMKAESKSPSTQQNYLSGVRAFMRWCEENGQAPVLDRKLVRAWIAELLDNGAEAATAVARQLAVRRFSAWLTEEGETDVDPLLGLKAPKIPTKVLPCLTEDQVRRLVKACEGREFRDRRDEAIIRLMLETGLRRAEVIDLKLSDYDKHAGSATVRRGKGGKGRIVFFGPQTGQAIDRYVRARKSHRLAHTPDLWLGDGGKTFGYHGLRFAVKYRAEVAGIDGLHPHTLRHTFATRWKTARGSDDGLMAVAGWSSRKMIDRYTASTLAARAAAEALDLGLGNI